MPGKASRGPFHFVQAGGFSRLGRIILDKLGRGVVLLDARGRVLDANSLAVRLLKAGDGMARRSGRFVFSDAALNLSLNTVRTHLKQIFTRCEVQSQAELLHLLAQGPQHL